jgi:hypothetical protein
VVAAVDHAMSEMVTVWPMANVVAVAALMVSVVETSAAVLIAQDCIAPIPASGTSRIGVSFKGIESPQPEDLMSQEVQAGTEKVSFEI